MDKPPATPRLILLVALALFAFAGNSLLTRAALADPGTDPLAFAGVRLGAAALFLGLVSKWRGTSAVPRRNDFPSVLALAAYAVGFSLAYDSMSAASGAMILFSAVQLTMLGASLWRGETLASIHWIGLSMALGGLCWLLFPGSLLLPPVAALEMAGAGVAWGIYSIRGSGAADPVGQTTRNFIGAAPIAAVILIAVPLPQGAAAWGHGNRFRSGHDGLGYICWYAVLPRLSSLSGASLQLLVPVIAAVGGVLWLGEDVGLRLLGSGTIILAGIFLTLRPRA